MTRLFIVLKVRGQNKLQGFIPAKKGASPTQLKRMIPQRFGKNFSAIVVTEIQLKKILIGIKKRRRMVNKRKSKKKR